ncbi:gamma-glutamylcyclotransferase family protein [Methylocaldum sp.]|uniref:gamma-glutamylcyclotransferase family protein n=1 Tax=Methylocaldum sp. TaxID=1969727 RepID=UPI0039C91710
MPRTYNVFAYGTLQIPEVMHAVACASYPSQAARLHDYARYRIRNQVYPGVRSELGTFTDGILYKDVSARDPHPSYPHRSANRRGSLYSSVRALPTAHPAELGPGAFQRNGAP